MKKGFLVGLVVVGCFFQEGRSASHEKHAEKAWEIMRNCQKLRAEIVKKAKLNKEWTADSGDFDSKPYRICRTKAFQEKVTKVMRKELVTRNEKKVVIENPNEACFSDECLGKPVRLFL